MSRKNLTATEIAMSIGIELPLILPGSRISIKARPGQYLKHVKNSRPIDMAETINSMRGRYVPHQNKRECTRRALGGFSRFTKSDAA